MKNIIQGYRKMTGLSQQEMANIFNVSRQAYWNKENGKSSFKDTEKELFTDQVKKIKPRITIQDIFFSN